MTTPDPHPDTTELTTLYDASDQGRAEWWPGGLTINQYENGVWYCVLKVRDQTLCIDTVNDPDSPWWSHALAIVRDSAERWLRDDLRLGQWNTVWTAGGKRAYFDMRTEGPHHSLADAIRAEQHRTDHE